MSPHKSYARNLSRAYQISSRWQVQMYATAAVVFLEGILSAYSVKGVPNMLEAFLKD